MYSSTEVAKLLDIDPRALRRFLRSSPEWKAAGLGGRYSFTEDDIERLRADMKQPKKRVSRGDRPGITTEHMMAARQNPHLRRIQLAQRAERAERLAELRKKANV